MTKSIDTQIDFAIKSGHFQQALDLLIKSLNKNPGDELNILLLGLMHEKLKNTQEALQIYIRLIKQNPNNANAYKSIARLLKEDGQAFESLGFYQRGYDLDPSIETASDLALSYADFGLYEKACNYYQIALKQKMSLEALISFIFIKHQDPKTHPSELKELAQQCNQEFYEPFKKHNIHLFNNFQQAFRTRSPKSKPRLGFISGDFCHHPVAHLLIKTLEGLQEKYEIFAYYNNYRELEDESSQAIKNLSTKFIDVFKIKDTDLARLIFNNEIDILFDLNGFTKGERLKVFKLKPAPIQVSYLGYFGTLGLQEIDYLLIAKYLIPENENDHYVEKIYRLPTVLSCDINGLPELIEDQIPCLDNSFITFGAMNNLRKTSPERIKIWCEILKQVPNSKLIVDIKALKDEKTKNYFRQLFINEGIDSSRLELKATGPRNEFLENYHKIDICLDTFPYTGGSTSMEAMAMGVPVPTQETNLFTGRMTAVIWDILGIPEMITYTDKDYVDLVVKLANDRDRLVYYKKNLRQLMHNSAFNLQSVIKDFNNFIEDIWKEHVIQYS